MKIIKKNANITITVIMLVTILSAVVINTSVVPVYANGPTEPHDASAMWVEPSTIDLSTDTHSVGYKFNVTVWVNLTESCGGWQFYMIYNKAHLNATRCIYTGGTTSQFFTGITTVPLAPTFDSHNATHDYVKFGESWLFGPVRGAGYGSLSWVEFEVMALPPEGETWTSLLDISTGYHPPTSDTYALDIDVNEIPLTPDDAIYMIPELPSFLIPFIFIALTFLSIILVTKLRKPRIYQTKTHY